MAEELNEQSAGVEQAEASTSAPESLDDILNGLDFDDELDFSAKDASKPEESDDDEELEEVAEESELSDDEEAPKVEAKPAKGLIEVNGEKLSVEDLKSGYLRTADYTRKTQELAEQRKSFEMMKQEAEVELQKSIGDLEQRYRGLEDEFNTKQQWDYYIDGLKTSDPDLYDQIQESFSLQTKHLNNPIVSAQMKAMQAKLNEFESKTSKREQEIILSRFNQDLNEVKAKYGDKLKHIGLTPDWDGKIKDAWAKGAESVEKALLMVHGTDILKMYDSKAKLGKVKAQAVSRSKVATAGSLKRGPATNTKETKNFKKMNYDQILGEAVKHLGL